MTQISSTDFAVKIYRNLHTGADENFVSSLISGAINESRIFRKWMLKNSGIHGNVNARPFRASTNDLVPSCFGWSRDDEKRSYTRSDITIWNPSQEDEWNVLYERECNIDWVAANNIYAVFVETKWYYISKEDSEKLVSFSKRLGDNDNLRLMIIMSLERSNLNRIIREPRGKQETRISRVLNASGVKIITLSEIYSYLRRCFRSHSSSKTSIGYIAKEYLKLLISYESIDYWKMYFRDYPPSEGYGGELRETLCESIIFLALRMGYCSEKPVGYKNAKQILFRGAGKKPSIEKYKSLKEKQQNPQLSICFKANDYITEFDVYNSTYKKTHNWLKEIKNYLEKELQ